MPPTQTNNFIHTPQMPKITNTCPGYGETGHGRNGVQKPINQTEMTIKGNLICSLAFTDLSAILLLRQKH